MVNLNIGVWKVSQDILLSKKSKPQFNRSSIILFPKHKKSSGILFSRLFTSAGPLAALPCSMLLHW